MIDMRCAGCAGLSDFHIHDYKQLFCDMLECDYDKRKMIDGIDIERTPEMNN